MTQKTLYDGFCKVVEIDMENNTGSYKRELVRVGDSVAGVVADNHGIVFIRQQRANGMDSLIELPAGKIKGNGIDSELRREILEETGYDIPETRMKRMGSIVPSPGILDEVIHILECTCDNLSYFKVGAGGGLEEENEEIELIYFSHSQLLSRATDCTSFTNKLNFEDAKTVTGLFLYYSNKSQDKLRELFYAN